MLTMYSYQIMYVSLAVQYHEFGVDFAPNFMHSRI